MLKCKKTILLLSFLIFFLQFSGSLEIVEGRIKLVLHEGIGRFSLFYLSNTATQEYLSFFLDQDPRTSTLRLLVGNKIIRLGEDTDFRESIYETSDGAGFVWTSTTMEVRENFSFISSPGSPLIDGVKITLTLKNISGRDLEVGARFLFDTYLGEAVNIHFTSSETEKIVNEETIYKQNMVDYWVSPASGDTKNNGLLVITEANDVTTPDTIVFANWKRLNDASWDYTTSASRNFNSLPYSINDSAVCQIYEPVNIGAGDAREIVFLMGNNSPKGFTIDQTDDKEEITEILEKASHTSDIADSSLAVTADLNTLNDLISKINEKLENDTVTDQELAIIEQVVEEMKKKYMTE